MTTQSTTEAPQALNRRRRRAGRGKEEILRAAAGVIAERGAEGTRFSDVSRASGVPVSSLQYHFGNRQDLLLAAFDHVAVSELEAMAASLHDSADPWEQLRRLLGIGVAEADQTGAVWRVWVEYWRAAIRDTELRDDAKQVYRRWRGLVEQVVRSGMDSGRFRADVDPAVLAIQLTALADGIAVPIVLQEPVFAEAGLTPTEIVVDLAGRLLGVSDDHR